ncbi:hypothetical protein [Streptomyces sp. NPDC059262]|uniref:hypothetical protein n=1 Tax=Streptomyces sp. NPDC059262 TaxID=3346797 RepID=UPI00368477F3
MVVDFVRRTVELPEGMLPLYRAVKSTQNHTGWCGSGRWVVYDQAEAPAEDEGLNHCAPEGSVPLPWE